MKPDTHFYPPRPFLSPPSHDQLIPWTVVRITVQGVWLALFSPPPLLPYENPTYPDVVDDSTNSPPPSSIQLWFRYSFRLCPLLRRRLDYPPTLIPQKGGDSAPFKPPIPLFLHQSREQYCFMSINPLSN